MNLEKARLTGMHQSLQASVSFLLFLLWWVEKLSALPRVSTLVKFRTTSYDEWSKWCLSLWTFCPCAVVSVLRNAFVWFMVADLVDDLSLVYYAFDSFKIKVGVLGKSICSLSDLYFFSYLSCFRSPDKF